MGGGVCVEGVTVGILPQCLRPEQYLHIYCTIIDEYVEGHSLVWLRPSSRITSSKAKKPPALTGTLLIIHTE